MSGDLRTGQIKVGGVTYNKDDVVSGGATGNVIKRDSGIFESQYEVVLKDGTKIVYYEQKPSRHANVEILQDGSVNFNGLSGAYVIDTPKDDYYRLLGCEFTKVDISRTEMKFSWEVFKKVPKTIDNDTVIQDRRTDVPRYMGETHDNWTIIGCAQEAFNGNVRSLNHDDIFGRETMH